MHLHRGVSYLCQNRFCSRLLRENRITQHPLPADIERTHREFLERLIR